MPRGSLPTTPLFKVRQPSSLQALRLTMGPAGIPDSAYSYQTLGNTLSFITSIIAALLYGNIGIKVFYSSVLRDVFHMPPLDHRTGKFIWIALG